MRSRMARELATVDPQERFLDFFKKAKYRQKISQMAITGTESITVDFEELFGFDQRLAEKLMEKPDDYLQHAGNAVYAQLGIEDPEYAGKIEKVTVRIVKLLGKEQLRKLGSKQMGKLVMIEGIVVRATPVRPMVMNAAFRCKRCGTVNHVEQTGQFLRAPPVCPNPDCGREGPFEFVQDESTFIDSQDLRLQEKPEDLPPGQLPRTLNVKLVGSEIVDVARPGDHVSIVGVVRAFAPSRPGIGKLRIFILHLDANSIEVLGKEPEARPPSPEEEEKILALAKDPEVHKKIMNSIAPSIYGYDHIKEAIMYLLFGGVSKTLPDITVRGEMNALLIGDPGTAKSQLLQYVAKIAPRGLYTSGRGTTAAGLTAAVIREKGGSMSLEAGALVLADKGIACMTEDTEIYTGDGLRQVGKIWEQTTVPVFKTKTGREAKKTCLPISLYDRKQRSDLQGTAFMIMRKRFVGEVVKIGFASGLSLKVTPDHLLKRPTNVKNLWVSADQVKVGDDLRAPVNVFGPAISLNFSPNEAYVIGCVYGDGWFGDSSITISQSKVNQDVVKGISKRMPSTFNIYDKGDRNRQLGKYILVSRMFQLYSAKKEFVHQAQLLLKSPSIDKVLMLDEQALWAFFAGVLDTDGDFNHVDEKVVAVRLYPTKDEHELSVLLYALRRLGIYARIHGQYSTVPIIQITGADISRFILGVCSFSVKTRRQPQTPQIQHKGKRSLKRGLEKVVSVERVAYAGYVYDLSVGKYHNYEAALVYIHNCIDEMDKMRPEDRVAIHEAMEQHTVSVAKGGIVATLNARTAMLAAANPALGRYEPHRTVAENISLPVTILSRFDLIFVLRDVPNKEADAKMSEHILEIHRRGASPVEAQIDADLIRKYVSYAKTIKPRLSKEALKHLSEFYLAMRSASETEGSPVAITARQLESLVRISEARARVALRKEVTGEDAEAAIAIMKRSLEEVGIDLSSYKMDIDLIMTGRPKSVRDKLQVVISVLMEMEKETGMVEKAALVSELELKHNIPRAETERMIWQLLREGTIYEHREGYLKKT
jgi:replicative DNA helicase Mcm